MLIRLVCTCLGWIGLDWIGLDQIGLVWFGSVWLGLAWLYDHRRVEAGRCPGYEYGMVLVWYVKTRQDTSDLVTHITWLLTRDRFC